MTENLADMLQEYKKKKLEEPEIEESKIDEQKSNLTIPNQTSVNMISFINWIDKNNNLLASTSDVVKLEIKVKEAVVGKSVGFKAPNLKGEKDERGFLKKDLFFIKEIDTINVLDLPVYNLKFFKRDIFRIIHEYSPQIYIKEYSVKMGSVLVFCTPSGPHLIPYFKTKVKNKDQSIKIVEPNIPVINEKLKGTGDIEALQLLYRQAIKNKENLKCMEDIVTWLLGRYAEAIDINHQIQIDTVLISQFNY